MVRTSPEKFFYQWW
uniref:Uncharacterized protein n=1 Tax=Anopheles albimanus TaxID=7167 RepID=A0A182FZA4_ANOAL